jgi:hypothetical protein
MSGKTTILKGENLTITTAVRNLAALQTAAVNSLAAQVKVKRLEISQNSSTTLAMVRGEIATRDTAGTLTTTSAAPTPVRPVAGPASGFSGNTSVIGGAGRSGINASVDSGGTYTQILPFNFPNTAGYLFKPDPDEEIWIPPSTVFVVRFLADPSALTGWTFSLWLVEE